MKTPALLTLAAFAALAGPSLATHAEVAGGATDPVVIELFTSQGCSSCPPADRLATQLAKDPTLVVISRPVTYWDNLGWRDTLAKPESTVQ